MTQQVAMVNGPPLPAEPVVMSMDEMLEKLNTSFDSFKESVASYGVNMQAKAGIASSVERAQTKVETAKQAVVEAEAAEASHVTLIQESKDHAIAVAEEAITALRALAHAL